VEKVRCHKIKGKYTFIHKISSNIYKTQIYTQDAAGNRSEIVPDNCPQDEPKFCQQHDDQPKVILNIKSLFHVLVQAIRPAGLDDFLFFKEDSASLCVQNRKPLTTTCRRKKLQYLSHCVPSSVLGGVEKIVNLIFGGHQSEEK
jgi:hypothetical protein